MDAGRRRRSQEGAVTAEHVAAIVLVAAVVAALLALALPGRVGEAGEQAVDCLFDGQVCELASEVSDDDPPSPPPSPPPGTPEGDGWPPFPETGDELPDGLPPGLPDLEQRPDESDEEFLRRQIEAIAELIPLGQEALAILERYGVELLLEHGADGQFDPTTNEITLDSSLDPAMLVWMLVHEAAHAEWRLSGDNEMDPGLGPDDYVEHQMDNELNAQLQHILAGQQLQELDPTIEPAWSQAIYEEAYEAGIREAVAYAQSQGFELSEEQRRRAGERAGEDRIRAALESGEITPGPPGEGEQTYPEQFEEFYEEVNG